MIDVSGLSKRFGPVRALDGVSFRVEEGEILGFLGPNGAGKSTTMRILSGYIDGDEGSVRVCGLDVRTRSLDVRRSIGYLPEAVPLYPEMRISEYLRFRARIKGIPRVRRRAAIARSLDRAGISDVRRRIVGTLSRGYRQRVGVADALLGDPRVLILDEPTVGLDPEQVRQFRQLLMDVGKDRTVILSTHILSEVELVCSTVAIIDRGRIVASGTVDEIRGRIGSSERIVAEIAGPAVEIRGALEGDPRVGRVRIQEGTPFHRVRIDPRVGDDLREDVFRLAKERGWSLRELRREIVLLEDAFIDILRTEEKP